MPTRKSSSAETSLKKGQTLIEFVFVSILFVFMIALSFNAVIAMSLHQYMSYATFMTARSFQAAASSRAVQVENARKTLALYLPGRTPDNVTSVPYEIVFPAFKKKNTILVTNVVLPTNNGAFDYGSGGTLEVQQGNAPVILIEYEVPLANLPLGDELRGLEQITLTARSYLGREPSRDECRTFFQRFYNHYTLDSPPFRGGGSSMQAAQGHVRAMGANMEDNGC